jgi:nucleoside 2-deoxyribosyltransferase
MKIYLASPLGFADSSKAYMDVLRDRLSAHVDVVNPWDDKGFGADFERAIAMTDRDERLALLRATNDAIGRANADDIRAADGVVAILDGVDVDSGTAAEIGFAFALGKWVSGLRTDIRQTGENEAAVVNLQVRHFIDASGGTLVTNLDDLEAIVEAWASEIGTG